MLDALGPPVRPAGVVLGADADGEPVAVTLVRPAPTRVVLLGGLYLARQVTLRAVGTGTRAVVVTGRPPVWDAVRRAGEVPGAEAPDAPGADDPAAPVRVVREAPADLAAGGEPLLVVYDRGATARGPAPARRPRQTTLVVLPSLVPAVSDLADDADLVLIQRLPPHEAELAGQALATHAGDDRDPADPPRSRHRGARAQPLASGRPRHRPPRDRDPGPGAPG